VSFQAEGHAAHSYGVSDGADAGKLVVALGLILGLMVLEATVGVVANSLALLSDAGHMLTDAAAIGLSLLAARLAARPAKGALTYGFKRVEILSAQANGVTLLILAAFIAYEGIRRLFDPPHVLAGLMLVVALIGVVVNLAASWTLAKANRQSMNVEGSFQHILTDLYAFIGTAIAAGVILLTGFERADAIVSLLVACLMVRSGYGLVKASGRVFLEAAPEGLDPRRSAGRWCASPVWSRFTTCTYGRSPRVSRALGARARRPRERLPRRASRAGADAARRVRPAPHDPPSRPPTSRAAEHRDTRVVQVLSLIHTRLSRASEWSVGGAGLIEAKARRAAREQRCPYNPAWL